MRTFGGITFLIGAFLALMKGSITVFAMAFDAGYEATVAGNQTLLLILMVMVFGAGIAQLAKS